MELVITANQNHHGNDTLASLGISCLPSLYLPMVQTIRYFARHGQGRHPTLLHTHQGIHAVVMSHDITLGCYWNVTCGSYTLYLLIWC